jgi:hypothetical protein
VYHHLRQKYPDSPICVGTIDDLAIRLRAMKNLPVIEEEIGDTWIHGLGTDPEKVSRFKKVERALQAWQGELPDLSDNLLCVPEHTWGLNMKRHFPFDGFYTHEDVISMREECAGPEKSWEEQREYVKKAEQVLGITPDYPVKKPDIAAYTPMEIPKEIDYEISWQLFDQSDYERYMGDYMRSLAWWAIEDFVKVGLPDYKGGIFKAKVCAAYQKGEEKLYRLEFNAKTAKKYGLPYFYLCVSKQGVDLKWFGKQPSRLPQAFWFKIKGLDEHFEIRKMGIWIQPEKIVGSPLISATDFGVRNNEYTIESLDCALVAPYGRRLLQYGVRTKKQDLYFNLYNNIWNTNFPMWYSDDAMFRFLITKNQK